MIFLRGEKNIQKGSGVNDREDASEHLRAFQRLRDPRLVPAHLLLTGNFAQYVLEQFVVLPNK